MGKFDKEKKGLMDVIIKIKKEPSEVKYRFYFHYYRRYNEMSIHFKNNCMRAKEIKCDVPTETKWNNQQPHIVLQGWAESVEIKNNVCHIK